MTAYERCLAQLRQLADTFESQGIEKLPPERELVIQLTASRPTIRRALAQLESEGRFTRVLGRAGGAYLTRVIESTPLPASQLGGGEAKIVRDLNTVRGVPQILADQGFRPGTRVVSESVESASTLIADRLQIQPGDPVYSLLRVRLADEQPLSLERMYLALKRFPDLASHSPIDSMYELLRGSYGVVFGVADESIETIPAGRQAAGLLGVGPATSVFALRRTLFDVSGVPIETSLDLFRSDRTRLHVRAITEG